ncbi:MAG: electron transfer flavoprotein subunit alpha [Deltaproteobacteria bacterium]|nr:electron transfer flavoprotein subunit alpha [Deltaproteobacteria bacterium]MBW1931738.1 electron transfer flavoprotein subunit alpha [Deltaproteobacteria bacterium]MBW1937942.1 electron transfer flavoprotein subunit alpha [Deltaproteobacteria bacterium]MBW1964674.1 electron transfer flavoprotein subunit alpha [Deltaproteobacteria bacterium]MBW2350213.1 electron transfer flavoprotein subunit alpha [Deltaproteobacteria bacterium]
MLKVDTEKCTGCGECEESCTFEAIFVEDEVAVVNQDACTLCGICVDACPEGALELHVEEGLLATDLSSWKGIWVVAECRNGVLAPVTLELLAKSRELAGELDTEVTAVLMGYEIESKAKELIFNGADRVFVVDHPELATFTDEVYGNILADLAKKEKPEIILAGATAMGRSYIPRVATILETGLTADCTGLDVRAEDRALLQTRPAFGGNLLATIVCSGHRPQMATVRPHVIRANIPDPGRKGEVIHILPGEDLLSHRVQVLESVKEQVEGPNLSEADVIVTAGRGFEQEKNVELARELADLLGGTVGATRAAVDAGWLCDRTQIGQTGVTVSPKLYMACGVSGAIQHIVGMQGSEIIVAINKDAEAPIFDVATYGLVGDVKEILPLLIHRIQKERGS